jgi:hypothetical protein
MPCLAHLDANGKSTHDNRNCKFVNDLKADLEASYKHARKNRPCGRPGKIVRGKTRRKGTPQQNPRIPLARKAQPLITLSLEGPPLEDVSPSMGHREAFATSWPPAVGGILMAAGHQDTPAASMPRDCE